MMKTIYSIGLVLLTIIVSAQIDTNRLQSDNDPKFLLNQYKRSVPFMNHYNLPNGFDTYNRSIVTDSENNLILANLKGILIFNGSKWENIETPNIPYILKKSDKKDLILIGGDRGFGYLSKNRQGKYIYQPIKTMDKNIDNINQIEINSKWVVFGSEKSIYLVNKESYKIEKKITSRPEQVYAGFFIFKDKIIITDTQKSVYSIAEDNNFTINKLFTENKIEQVIFSLKTSDDKIILGTTGNNLLIYNGKTFTKFNIEDNEYINKLGLTSGILLSDNRIALGTLNGGSLIINSQTGKTIQIINYQSKLPDNEIHALYSDKNNNNRFWLTHGKGISYIDLEIPIHNYMLFPEIKGGLLTMSYFNQTLYIATTSGVYYLDSAKSVNEVIDIYYKKLLKTKQRPKNKTGTKPKEENKELTFQEKWKITKQIWDRQNKEETET